MRMRTAHGPDPYPTTPLRLWPVAVALGLLLGGVGLAPRAVAGVSFNTIDPIAVVTDTGRHLIVTGPLTCTAGERAFVRVTVTQRTTGAVAEGRTRLTCTGAPQHWTVHAGSHGEEPFQDAPAVAVAMARTTADGAITDAHQWLVTLTLVGD
jgi:hypothetical protein